jgi:hypothetical protein
MGQTGRLARGIGGVRERYLLAIEEFVDIHAGPRLLSVGADRPTVTRMLEMTP